MKVAIVYNRESLNVVNIFGLPNKEKIGRKTIARVADALREGGHQVEAIEGDKDLIGRLEEFMPRVLKGERPGMVFNVSYGIQGQARYTHVPSILEMIGVPYVASGPLAHSLSLDKVVTKMILRQHDLPTPDFTVLTQPDTPVEGLAYPLIVKPKNEAVSFGLKIVHDEDELRAAAKIIFDEYRQPVLVEQYIEGREINVGLLGNGPPQVLPPVELIFTSDGPRIYTYEDKTGRSGRQITHRCPAEIGDALLDRARDLAVRAFEALGCYDCARVDMRLDQEGNLFILETNSLPSLGEHGSYLVGAAHVGLDFKAVINRLVEVASARYFGTPDPPTLERSGADPKAQIFSYVTQRRDAIEKRLREWVGLASRTGDPIGLSEAGRLAGRTFEDLRMRQVPDLTDRRSAWTWETEAGFAGGTLFVAHLDVPAAESSPPQGFRREPEWLYGEGIAVSRAPLVTLEFALRALRGTRRLRRQNIGVLLYTDEGTEARDSQELIRTASSRAARVLVMRPGGLDGSVVIQRRGQRTYLFRAEGEPRRPGRSSKKQEVLRWAWNQLESFSRLTDHGKRVSVSAVGIQTEAMPLLLPHRVTVNLSMTYPELKAADDLERRMRESVRRREPKWDLELLSDRPPMNPRRPGADLMRRFEAASAEWEIPFTTTKAVWPSVAGLVPDTVACLCGAGPAGRDIGTPHEAVRRLSLVQRTLTIAQFLLGVSGQG